MFLIIKIKTGNDAMLSWGDMARSLNDLASEMMGRDGEELSEDDGIISDLNGQRVGRWDLVEE